MMEVAGRVAGLWRYPVKSMGGECLQRASVGPLGLKGDRMLAFESAGAAIGKPLVSGVERTAMLRSTARFLDPDEPLESTADPARVEVVTENGLRFRANDPGLITALQAAVPEPKPMFLRVCERPAMDCRPVGLLSLETLQQLSQEWGSPLPANRFRANILLALEGRSGFGEDAFVGRTLQIGEHTRLAVTERDPRCRVVTLDPATGQREPHLMTHLARRHEGKVGIYAVVVTAGPIAVGDPVLLV